MIKNTDNGIASAMDAILKDPNHIKLFNPSIEKLAFTRVADENIPTEIEIEVAKTLNQENVSVKIDENGVSVSSSVGISLASVNDPSKCSCCGKERAGQLANAGECKCASVNGCSVNTGCKENCDCGCNVKQAGVSMSDKLVKSAFDALLKASSDLEEAGFEGLSVNALVLMQNLVVEAKAKKDDKKKKEMDKNKAKDKAKSEKERAKAKAEKDKNDAKDKAMKAKMKEKAKSDKK